MLVCPPMIPAVCAAAVRHIVALLSHDTSALLTFVLVLPAAQGSWTKELDHAAQFTQRCAPTPLPPPPSVHHSHAW